MVTDVCHEFSFYHELSNFRIVSSHGVSRKVTDFFVPNYRIVELILSITRRIAEVTNYRIIELFLHTECRGRSRIIELSNFLHTENRGRSRVFVTRLVLGPTDQREVIIELSNYYFQSRGESRKVTVFCHGTGPLDPLTNGR